MSENQKRGRGRPPGSKNKPKTVMPDQSPQEKRERGRPRTKSAVWSPADIR